MENKLMPSLWFSETGGEMAPIVEYYKGVFGDAFEAGTIVNLGETPSGKSEMCEVKIFGQKYSLMSTAQKHDPFNDAFALTVQCDDQAEIDKYWNYFTKDGSEVQCGWCIDKYGLRWQVLPKNFGELMSGPDSWKIMMGQKKIVIAEYLQ